MKVEKKQVVFIELDDQEVLRLAIALGIAIKTIAFQKNVDFCSELREKLEGS